MKKSVATTIAVLGMSSVAHAQSSVTLYGIIDAGVTYVSNEGGHRTVIEDTGVAQASRWGLQGAEDLGDGMKAIFWLENGFTLGNGTLGQGGLLFGRTAMVGLSSRVGKLTFGRQYDFMVENLGLDTSNARFAGAYGAHPDDIDRLAGEQVNNSVKYLSPSFRGVTVGAMYGFSNVPGAFSGASGSPRFTSFGLNYDSGGPLAIGLAYTNSNGAGGSLAESVLRSTALRNVGAGARYRYATVTLFGNYTNNRISGGPNNAAQTIQEFESGFDWFVFPALDIGLDYTFSDWSNADYNQVNAAVHYFLSKRTDVYISGSYVHSNSASEPPGLFLIVNPATNVGYSSSQNQLALRVGIRTNF